MYVCMYVCIYVCMYLYVPLVYDSVSEYKCKCSQKKKKTNKKMYNELRKLT